jgi:pyruvate dehydrogenase E1 component alpha subunit
VAGGLRGSRCGVDAEQAAAVLLAEEQGEQRLCETGELLAALGADVLGEPGDVPFITVAVQYVGQLGEPDGFPDDETVQADELVGVDPEHDARRELLEGVVISGRVQRDRDGQVLHHRGEQRVLVAEICIDCALCHLRRSGQLIKGGTTEARPQEHHQCSRENLGAAHASFGGRGPAALAPGSYLRVHTAPWPGLVHYRDTISIDLNETTQSHYSVVTWSQIEEGRSMATQTRPRTKARRSPAARDEQLREFYKDMLLIRRFEERAARAYTEALVGGYCHLNLGEEAAVVGLMAALKPTDYLFTNYREHGYALMRGIDPNKVMAELYGRVDGVSKGWGGSMHMFDVTHRLLGGYGIVGGQLPLATGAALAIDYRESGDVVMCTLGDGTTAIGAFHEALNIAALWHLPVVFVIINNHLGMGTTVEHSSAEPELYKRGAAYRMESERVYGDDPAAVLAAAEKAVDSARAGKPYLLEVMTERLRGHSVVDPAKYRSSEEVERLKAGDVLGAYKEKLLANGVLSEEAVAAIEQEVTTIVTEAADFAAASPHPSVDTLFDYTYASPVPNDSRRLPGQPLFEPLPIPGVPA